MTFHLVNYLLKSYIRSHRYFPAIVFFLLCIMILYSYKPNPVVETYALSAVFLYIISAWICYSFLNSTNRIHGQIISLHAGSIRTYLIGKIVMVCMLCFCLCILAVLYPLATNMFDEPLTLKMWLLALAIHFEISLLGIIIPLFFNRSFIKSGSFSISCILIILVITLAKNGIIETYGSWLIYLFWLMPPAFQMINMFSAFDNYSSLSIFASLFFPILYFMVCVLIYLKLQQKRM